MAGGEATDILIGGPGSDTFVFDTLELTTYQSFRYLDEIQDFNQGNTPGTFDPTEGDRLDLSAIVGTAYNGGNGVSYTNLVRLVRPAGTTSRTVLEVNPDGIGDDWIQIAYMDGVSPGTPIDLLLDPNSANQGNTPPDKQINVRSQPGSWTISPVSQTINENDGTISFLVTRLTTDRAETVYISTTVNQRHANNNDYTYWLNQPVTFAAGQDHYTVNIHINDDNHDEVIETFGLIIQSSPSQPASEYLKQATFSIIDDDLAGSSATFTANNDLVWIEPSGGTEYFNGLAGTDTATLNLTAWSAGISSSTSGSTLIFSRGSDSLRFDRVENFFVIAGSGHDNLSAGNGNNGLFGGAGNDTLYAGTGFDILDGGAGDDVFYNVGYGDFVAGGTGTDTVNFNVSGRTNNITINLSTGQGPGATWTGVELVSGTLGSGNDDVTAGMQLMDINGNSGTDSLTLDYSGTLADGRTATLLHFSSLPYNNNPEYVYLSDGTYAEFYISNFERYTITGTLGDDVIDGSAASGGNTFYGLAGNDTLTGGAGVDVFDGGEGDDTF